MSRHIIISVASLFLIAFLGVVHGHESTVPDISEQDFVKKHSEGKLSIIFFYAPWCGHCKNFMPVFDEFIGLASTEMPKVLVAKVDATKSPKLSQQYDIQGYPTLLLLRGSKVCKYGGERELKKLSDWAKGIIQPSVVDTAEKVDSILSDPLHSIVAFFEDDSSPLKEVIVDILCEGGISAQGGIHFLQSKELAQKMKFPSDKHLAVFQAGAEPKFYEGVATAKEISLFIAFASNPLVLEYSSANANIIFHSAIQSYLFVQIKKDETDPKTIMPVVEEIAKEFFGSVRVSWLDVTSTDGKAAVEFFGVRHTPSLVMYNSSSNAIFGDISAGIVEVGKIRQFISDYKSGLLKPFRKEQPLPENWNTGPVYELVAGNFDEVLKWGKPVFVKFYAPWCGHCKALMPDWEKLGSSYNLPDKEGKIVIAKCDSTQNDIEGISVQHFPTLIAFLPDGSKVTYDGERKFDALKSFIDSGFKVPPKPADKKPADAADSAHDEL